ncbi:hypothetical protein ACJMQP_27980 [Rhodopseudomonas palustris]
MDAAPAPNFLAPVFGDEIEDSFFMQVIDEKDNVVDFSRLPQDIQDRITSVTKLPGIGQPDNHTIGIGDSALYSFRTETIDVLTETRRELSNRLSIWLTRTAVNPFLKLEILDFCRAEADELRDAIATAGKYLVRRGITQGDRWAEMQTARIKTTQTPQTHLKRSSRFWRVAETEQTEPPLPLVYETTGHGFRNLIERSKIEPKPHRVLDTSVLTAFYGRPAYSPKTATDASLYMLPVIVILRPHLIAQSKKVFPFEVDKYYLKSEFFSDFQLNDFECPPLSAGQLVSAFYGSNLAYLSATAKPQAKFDVMNLDPLNFEAQAFQTLLQSNARSLSIEVHFDHSIPIDASTTEAIILPYPYLDDKSVQAFFDHYQIDVIPYSIMPITPDTYSNVIMDLVADFYNNRNYLDEDRNMNADEFRR